MPQKRIGRDNPSPPYKIYVASHVEVSSANAVPGGFARAPFHDPASALYPPPLPRGPMGTTHPPIIHTSGHLVPPPRRSARGQAGLLFLYYIWGSFFPLRETTKRGGTSRYLTVRRSNVVHQYTHIRLNFGNRRLRGFPYL